MKKSLLQQAEHVLALKPAYDDSATSRGIYRARTAFNHEAVEFAGDAASALLAMAKLLEECESTLENVRQHGVPTKRLTNLLAKIRVLKEEK